MLFEYNYTWGDAVGNLGVVLLIINLYLNVHGTLHSQGFWYNFINLIIAICLFINLVYKPNLSGFIIEIFWGAISIYGLYKYFKQRKQQL